MTSRSKNNHKNRGAYNARSSYGNLRKLLAMPLLISVLAMGCEPPAEAPAQSGDLFTSSQERFEPATGNRLESSFGDSEQELNSTEEEENVLESNFLIEVAQNYATDLVNMNPATTACSAEYIRDLEGNPTAFSVLYPKEGGSCDFNAMADHLNKSTTNAIYGMESGSSHLNPLVRQIRNPDKFIHVLVGATPMDNPLISLSEGLPPASFEELGRYQIAKRLGIEVAQVETEQVFYESLMPKGNDLGIMYTTTGTSNDQSVMYLMPNAGNIRGGIFPLTTYQELRTQHLMATAEEMELPMEEGATDAVDQLRIAHLDSSEMLRAEWNRLLDGRGISKACPGCTDDAKKMVSKATLPGFGADDNCECWYTYSNYSTVSVDTCDGFEADCCEFEGDNYSNCLKRCDCECEGDWIDEYDVTTTEHGDQRFIRGVPVLYQYDVSTTLCGTQPVGCGPVAIAELAIFYDQLGYKNLSDGYMSSGKIDWKDMVQDIYDDHVTPLCTFFTHGTAVLPTNLTTGFRSFFEEQGYDPTVTRKSYRDSKESSALSKIKSEVAAGRPIVIGYDSDNASGLGSGGDDWGFIDHYAIISGYKTSKVFANTGWGAGNNEWYYWNIGKGKVHLYTIKMKSSEKSSTKWCLHNGLNSTYLKNSSSTGYTFEKSSYDGHIVNKQLVGNDCAVLDNGSTSTYTVDGHYAMDYESHMCPPTSKDFEDLENAIEEECENNPWFPCP